MIRNSFLKETVLSEKGMYHSEEFSGGSCDCFSMSFPLSSFSLVVLPEVIGIFSCSLCHKPDNPSQMRASSFGDFILPFKPSGLFDNRVKPTEANEFGWRWESLNGAYLCHKVYCTLFPNTWYGSKDSDFPFKNSLCTLLNNFLYFSHLLLQTAQSFDFYSEELLHEWESSCDGGLSHIVYSLNTLDFSSSFSWGREHLRESFPWDTSYYLSGRKGGEDGKDFFAEGVKLSFKLREEDGEEGFNFCFSFSDCMGDSLFFSYNRFNHLGFWRVRDGLIGGRRDEELTDGFSIFGVGFRGFRVEEAGEVEESVGVDGFCAETFFFEEGEEVQVVDGRGLQADEEGIFEGGDKFLKGEEAGDVHREGRGEDGGRTRGEGNGERILRDINTTEIVNHSDTSIDGLEGDSLPLNLLVEVCPEGTINLYETGREENMLLCEPKSSGRMVFHPLPVSFLSNSEKNLNTIFLSRRLYANKI